ncbi:hypothetical protein O181_058917 [Austropuccinia psidii MF-1]|uniref:Retrovirus-related Pol polyprotein from transposon TNT 1-94 n=1 Tax=Austropuccinia psidii MF-1 TaxID=1389203 RepID=A0A9Q3EFN7_9BASI|nr:hypothetical protein [Austropuccinia psidii MF-1]
MVFLSIIGLLSYLVNGSRPDLCFAVNLLSRYQNNRGEEHWCALNHFLGYLKNTSSLCLRLCPFSFNDVEVFSDASWGGEFGQSFHGFIAMLYNFPISWSSKRLVMVSALSCHAEYMALNIASQHGLCIRELLGQLLALPVTVHLKGDNASCTKICKDSTSNKQTQHLARNFFIINQALFEGKATLTWIPSGSMFADVITRPLGPSSHTKFTDVVMTNMAGSFVPRPL